MTSTDGPPPEHPSVSKLLLGSEGHTSALLPQVPLLTTMVVIGAAYAPFHPELLVNPLFLAGYVVLALSIVSALLIPWHLLGAKAVLLLPMMGFLAVGLSRAGSQSVLDVMGLLAVFPAIRLASADKYRGAVIGALATAAMIGIPLLFISGSLTSQQLARLTIFPVVVLAVGLTVSVVTARLERQTQAVLATTGRLERALSDSREQRQLLRSILDAVDVGVIALDPDGNAILANNDSLSSEAHAAEEALRRGAPRAEWAAIGEAQKIMFETDRKTPVPADRRPVARAIRGEIYSNYLFWVEEQGRRRAYYATSRPILSNDAGSAGVVVAFSNVTQLLDALTAQNAFVASVSHELRTPLTSILGYADLLRERLDEAGITFTPELDVIERNAQRLRSIVQDLLTAAESTMSISPVRMDLAAAVHNAVDSIAPVARHAGIRIENRVRQPLAAMVDPHRIGQVLDNLLSNAVKYSPSGTAVSVCLQQDPDTGDAVLEIADQGTGISAADAELVFSQFYRSASARNSAVPGAGLGLSIAKSIVDRHGGSIRLIGNPENGTTAVLRLPAGTPQPDDHQAAAGTPAS
ncbi:PAS domain-containing sensor histidine kinase [Paenarthrobacter sp. Z7-10]|uniref:sensor histidine kinase n=1 Tax=Paenarthrobacter sp. Z7-10 TaxID=2787635 RepID=UPI0022A989F5|nr:PAS domain-containing sensor histidine kinase [Paenarthrobacter sp. Z7-10]MCZ2402924.1 PAS domain-containing sensor histidine kinase [Paenarthrobacter sp. Z7-10]